MSITTHEATWEKVLGRDELRALSDEELAAQMIVYRERLAICHNAISVAKERTGRSGSAGRALHYLQAGLGNIRDIQKERNKVDQEHRLKVGELIMAARNLLALANDENNEDAWGRLEAAVAAFPAAVHQ